MESQLPAGLVDNNVELFNHIDSLNCLSGGNVFKIKRLSIEAREIALNDMFANKRAYDKICSWGYQGEDKLNKYLSCRCGGFDNVPDIDLESKKLNPEFWNCKMRSFCDGSGVVCIIPKGPGGQLSHRQLDVIKSLEKGEPQKAACDRIGIKYNTYRAYLKSIYKKTGVHSNVELLQFARNNNII